MKRLPLGTKFYIAPPAPLVPPEKWVNPDIHYAEENGFAEGWNACRTAMLRGNHRDLSQPIGQQVAEYEKIMLQGRQPVSDRDELPVL